MRRALVQSVLSLLLALAGTGALCAAPPPATPGTVAEQSLTLLQQADLQGLAPAARQQLLIEVAAQQLAAGQIEPAVPLLTRAVSEAEPLAPPWSDRLRSLAAQLSTAQLAALAAGAAATPNAPLLNDLLAARHSAERQQAVAVLLPLTGRYAPYGEQVRRGIELAQAGAPKPEAVVFRLLDSAGDSAVVERLLDELAAAPLVQAVIGPLTSGEAPAAASRAAVHGLPLLLLAPRDGTTGSARGIFRLALTAEAQVRAVVSHAVQTLGLKRFAILAPATRQGEQFAELFSAELARLGGVLAARHSYAPEAVDLRADLQQLAGAIRAAGGAEALFLPDGPRQIGQIAPQLGFARLDRLQLLGIAAWHTPELTRLAGPTVEGALLADSFCADRALPQVAAFVAAFRSAYGREPTALEALGFDSAGLLLTALSAPSVRDRATLAQALATVSPYPAVGGPVRFAANGEAESPLCLLQVQDGTFVPLN